MIFQPDFSEDTYTVETDRISLFLTEDCDLIVRLVEPVTIDRNLGYIRQEKIAFAGPLSYAGFRFFYLDQIGALSEAPAIVLPEFLPEGEGYKLYKQESLPLMPYPHWTWNTDWDNSIVWSAIEYYQIRSPLNDLAEKGECIFRLARE